LFVEPRTNGPTRSISSLPPLPLKMILPRIGVG
jgi:hypothetical protein